ncbi:protein of unknown function [[Clostridium] ultunense Esp]|uniref:Uncharacterized protein n=1 Tax=[Clostridium] ultunense Esp TaxID=1288971 RepID=A0A1M4PMT2_9FIRM|nr:protein of unknown function [[Clostridium] ultunense Esp]
MVILKVCILRRKKYDIDWDNLCVSSIRQSSRMFKNKKEY